MNSKKIIKYRSDPMDADFRKHVMDLFNSARKEVVIITGEGSAFGYQDIRWAVKEATERGVKYKVYATAPLFIDKWLAYGCDVYQGKEEIKDHYLVVDKKSFIHSYPHLRKEVGVREGEVHLNDPEEARKILEKFEKMIAKAKKASSAKDPLFEFLEHPRDWKVKTDSSKIDESIYA